MCPKLVSKRHTLGLGTQMATTKSAVKAQPSKRKPAWSPSTSRRRERREGQYYCRRSSRRPRKRFRSAWPCTGLFCRSCFGLFQFVSAYSLSQNTIESAEISRLFHQPNQPIGPKTLHLKLSHRILRHTHGVLNIDEIKKLIV
jgi:hypothetical protein